MPCIDRFRPLLGLGSALLALLMAGCASRPPAPAAPAPAVMAVPSPATTPVPQAEPVSAAPLKPEDAAQGTPATAPAETAAAPAKAPPRYVKLGPPKTPRNWDELRLQAAQRLVAAHPDSSYLGTPPSILLAIPILQVELNADGSVREIRLLRAPGRAPDTTQLAIDAIRRAAPFGNVSKLEKPWKFVEVFLFDDERRFMPRTLDR